jgi:hypothetical protein
MYRSGIHAIDDALGNGQGVPSGSVVEIYGPPDTGKTALALWYCRTLQAADPDAVAVWIAAQDLPSDYNLKWARIDGRRFGVAAPTPSVPGLHIARRLIEAADLVVVDSVAALVALNAAQDLEKLYKVIADPVDGLGPLADRAKELGKLVLLVNQERHFPDARATYHCGACLTLTRCVDYRLRLSAGEGVYQGPTRVGTRLHYRVVRNGGAPAGQTGRLNCSFQKGLFDLRSYIVRLPQAG